MKTFTSEKIREHLQRILRRSSFADSAVLTNFLSFIVNETIEGRSHELKEYTIAINALKKEPDFNPQIDSIVRIHAGRMRRALKEYYYEEGARDELQIFVPKGSYIPAFIENGMPGTTSFIVDQEPGSSLAVRENLHYHASTLAIFPFEDISENKSHVCFIKGLEMCLATDLTSNRLVRLISYFSTVRAYQKTNDIKEAGTLLNASFILTGCVQFGKHLRVHILLNACDTGAQLWALTVEKKDVDQLDLFSLQEEIANQVILPVFTAITNYNQHIANPSITMERHRSKSRHAIAML